MKKITFCFFAILLVFSSVAFSQTYSTGEMVLLDDGDFYYTAKIDVTSTLVTLTLNGPNNRYLGFGFGVQSMTTDGDVVIWLDDAGTFKLTDRTFQGIGVPPDLDTNQDWTITSNTVNGDQRTISATRVLDTGHDGDYVFSNSATTIDFVWSFGFSYSLTYHGENKGISMHAFTLSQEENHITNFSISPNPAANKLNIYMPNVLENAKITVFDVLGKKVYDKNINAMSSSIDVSKWNSGVYLVRISNDKATQTKRFVKQ